MLNTNHVAVGDKARREAALARLNAELAALELQIADEGHYARRAANYRRDGVR